MKKFESEQDYERQLYNALRDLMSNYGDFSAYTNINDMPFREIGLESMGLVGVFLELENEGWIDISRIDNDNPPKTMSDVVRLGVEYFRMYTHGNN
ncbi:MAG: hypothetical protein EOO43_04490 [Flavobacterium sp.]|nr:MAG: hypothetical protein EOO43_04490 [Flavobacterium sp.]